MSGGSRKAAHTACLRFAVCHPAPHPSPLPAGEGASNESVARPPRSGQPAPSPVRGMVRMYTNRIALHRRHLARQGLPLGEGWGECLAIRGTTKFVQQKRQRGTSASSSAPRWLAAAQVIDAPSSFVGQVSALGVVRSDTGFRASCEPCASLGSLDQGEGLDLAINFEGHHAAADYRGGDADVGAWFRWAARCGCAEDWV